MFDYFPSRLRRRSRIPELLLTFVLGVAVSIPLLALTAWVIMLALGGLAHELELPRLALSFWQTVLLRIAVGWLTYQHDFKD